MSLYSELSFDQLCQLAQALTSDLEGTDLCETWTLRELHTDLYDELHGRILELVAVETAIDATPTIGATRTALVKRAGELSH